MNSKSLWGNPFTLISSDVSAERKFLSSVPIFDTLSRRQLIKINKILHLRTFEDGEIVFRQGDPGVGMYIVRSGIIDVYNENDDMTRQKIFTLRPGDFFGEIALLNDSLRSATTFTSQKALLYGLFRPDLMSLMDADPKLGLKIIYRLSQIVAERLRHKTSEPVG